MPEPRKAPSGREGRPGHRRQYLRRRKVCKFCVEKIDDINYKDVRLINSFISERGKILPRRLTGTCSPHQRSLNGGHKARAKYCPASVQEKACFLAQESVLPGASQEDFKPWKLFCFERIENLGGAGQIVKVADGYGRNFLFPKKMAVPATPGNLKMWEQRRAKLLSQDTKTQAVAEKVAETLKELTVVITRKAGEKDTLFGSVTTLDISGVAPLSRLCDRP